MHFLLCALGMRPTPLLAGSEIQNGHAPLQMSDAIVLTSLIIQSHSGLLDEFTKRIFKYITLLLACFHQQTCSFVDLPSAFLSVIGGSVLLCCDSGWGCLTYEPAPPWRPCTPTTWASPRCRQTIGRLWAAERKDWCACGRWGWELNCGRCTTGGRIYKLSTTLKSYTCVLSIRFQRCHFCFCCWAPSVC